MTEPKCLSTVDIARKFGVSRNTVKRWAQEGRIHAAGQNARGWRYYLFTDIEVLLAQCLSGGASQDNPTNSQDEQL